VRVLPYPRYAASPAPLFQNLLIAASTNMGDRSGPAMSVEEVDFGEGKRFKTPSLRDHRAHRTFPKQISIYPIS
jgi:hypothetical protein